MLMQLQNFVIFRLRLSCQKFIRFSLRANAEPVALSGGYLLVSADPLFAAMNDMTISAINVVILL